MGVCLFILKSWISNWLISETRKRFTCNLAVSSPYSLLPALWWVLQSLEKGHRLCTFSFESQKGEIKFLEQFPRRSSSSSRKSAQEKKSWVNIISCWHLFVWSCQQLIDCIVCLATKSRSEISPKPAQKFSLIWKHIYTYQDVESPLNLTETLPGGQLAPVFWRWHVGLLSQKINNKNWKRIEVHVFFSRWIWAHLCEARLIDYKSFQLSMCLKSEDYNI